MRAKNAPIIQLALGILGNYGFNAAPLIDWIRTTLVSYLDDEDRFVIINCSSIKRCSVISRDVRKAAALTISSLLVGISKSDSKFVRAGDIISNLLAIGITDTGMQSS